MRRSVSLSSAPLFLFALLCLPFVLALSEYEYLRIVKQFADSYLAPTNIEIANTINSTLFAEDVTGTADLSTNFDGRELSTMGENNLLCRALHTPMLPLRPAVHCPHVGPTGGDMCIARDYRQVVLDSHFPAGWLAPKFVTPENNYLVGGLQAVSGEALDPLLGRSP
ncbi:hypothetical protein P7C73_g2063, partial [Tremellales sp. Uapishka_1]